ncbi:unnamed protein product, partial [Didymodactylos carnosus]
MKALGYLSSISDCELSTTDTNERNILNNKLAKWISVYKKTISASTVTSIFDIGICVKPNSTLAPDAAIVLKDKKNITGASLVIGKLKDVDLVATDTWLMLTYRNDQNDIGICNNQTSATLIFVCGQNSSAATPLLNYTMSTPRCSYVFQVEVPELCPKQAKKKMSAGAIFVIILLIVSSVYLIGGLLYMKFIRGARGLELIPHRDMWMKLGHLAA